MSQITLEAVTAKQTELAAMIAKLHAQAAATTTVIVAEATIELQADEHYAGAVLDADGKVKHHLVLMAEKPDGNLNWQASVEWARSIGGVLPTRQEQALLFANCKPHMDAKWHWSSEAYETDASYAWYCYFDDGYQGTSHESCEGCARAVRRA
jgi:hypothetical protein